MTSHLSIYVIINLKFSIVKLPKGIMAERSVIVKGEFTSDLLQAKGTPTNRAYPLYLWPRSKVWM